MDEKLDELIDSYEVYIKQLIKDDLNEMMTNEDNEEFDEDLKFNLTNIRECVNRWFTAPNGIRWGRGNNRENRYSIREEWYLENLPKFRDIILTFCPSYELPSSPIIEQTSKYGGINKFMELDNYLTMSNFYDKLIELHRRMKKEKIGYWKS